MRIAYCMSCLCSSGGVDRVVSVKANYLADVLGYEVAIITTDQRGREPFFELSPKIKIIDLGINYAHTNRTAIGKLYNSTLKRKIHAARLEKALADFSPDISIAVTRRELPILYRLRSGGVKIAERHMNKNFRLLDEPHTPAWMFRRWLVHREERWVSCYRCCVTQTEQDRAYWANYENIVVIPNPVTVTPDSVHHHSHKQVLAVGHLRYEKGYDRLIKAWALVSKHHPEWILSIVGSFDDTAEVRRLRQIIKSLKLTTVQLLPPSNDILYFYANSSVLVLTSRYEGMPLVLLEAMACGLPCLAFDCPCGPRDIITNGVDGILVKNNDIATFAEELKRLLESKKLRHQLGANGPSKAEQFSLPVVMQRWDALFTSLLQ